MLIYLEKSTLYLVSNEKDYLLNVLGLWVEFGGNVSWVGRSTNFELADQLMPAQASSFTQSLTQPHSLAHPLDVDDDVDDDIHDDVDDDINDDVDDKSDYHRADGIGVSDDQVSR